LQELFHLGPEQRLRRLLSSICVQSLYGATSTTLNRVMIVENAGNQTANQKKALNVRITSETKESNLNLFRAASI
jgi:hypothetical protein